MQFFRKYAIIRGEAEKPSPNMENQMNLYEGNLWEDSKEFQKLNKLGEGAQVDLSFESDIPEDRDLTTAEMLGLHLPEGSRLVVESENNWKCISGQGLFRTQVEFLGWEGGPEGKSFIPRKETEAGVNYGGLCRGLVEVVLAEYGDKYFDNRRVLSIGLEVKNGYGVPFSDQEKTVQVKVSSVSMESGKLAWKVGVLKLHGDGSSPILGYLGGCQGAELRGEGILVLQKGGQRFYTDHPEQTGSELFNIPPARVGDFFFDFDKERRESFLKREAVLVS